MSEDVSLNPAEFAQLAIMSAPGAESFPAPKHELPKNYNLEAFPEKLRDLAEVSILTLSEYLTYPINSNNFSNHQLRRDWENATRDKIEKDYGKEYSDEFSSLLQKNRAQGNTITSVGLYVELMRDYLPQEFQTKIAQLRQEALTKGRAGGTWDGPLTPDRVKSIGQLDDLVVQTLHFLSNPTLHPKSNNKLTNQS